MQLFSLPHLGLAKGSVHKVILKSTVDTKQQKLRRQPVEIREKVSAVIQKLKDAGIIERIDACEWFSPIVVTCMKTREICLGVSIFDSHNEIIVGDSHPLPHSKEIFSQHSRCEAF